MHIKKGLIIDEPWIGFILSGEKTWEMRSTATSFRGWFGLIRKGSGAVVGVARLVDVGPPLSPEEMIRDFEKHRIPESMIRSGAVAKWNTPWILADVRRLPRPVAYRHKSGAVTWVNLDDDVTAAIAASLGDDVSTSTGNPPAPAVLDASRAELSSSATAASRMSEGAGGPSSGMWGETEITEGNIRHNHFYMRSFIHRFPSDLIGGSNKREAAPRSALVDWGGPVPVETDIDGEKQFFRARGWVRRFFEANDAKAGDTVRVEETAPYRYRVSLRKR